MKNWIYIPSQLPPTSQNFFRWQKCWEWEFWEFQNFWWWAQWAVRPESLVPKPEIQSCRPFWDQKCQEWVIILVFLWNSIVRNLLLIWKNHIQIKNLVFISCKTILKFKNNFRDENWSGFEPSFLAFVSHARIWNFFSSLLYLV